MLLRRPLGMPLAYDSFENTNHIGLRLHQICTCSTVHLVSVYTLHDSDVLQQRSSDGMASLYFNRPSIHLRGHPARFGLRPQTVLAVYQTRFASHKSCCILWYSDYDILHGDWSLRSCLRISFRSLGRVVPKTLSASLELQSAQIFNVLT